MNTHQRTMRNYAAAKEAFAMIALERGLEADRIEVAFRSWIQTVPLSFMDGVTHVRCIAADKPLPWDTLTLHKAQC